MSPGEGATHNSHKIAARTGHAAGVAIEKALRIGWLAGAQLLHAGDDGVGDLRGADGGGDRPGGASGRR